MATTRSFAYNSGAPISGTTQVGDIAAGNQPISYDNGLGWWEGPDENLGYVICYAQTTGSRTAGNGTFNVYAPTIGFWRTPDLTDQSFLATCNLLFGQNFTDTLSAKDWLTSNGYWTSYTTPVLYLDAGDPSSYPGTGTVWTDLVGGKVFNLINNPTYNSGNGGKINFSASGQQYASCSTSLSTLSNWSVGVWHYYTGNNTGSSPCIVTEVYPGTTNTLNYSLGSLNDDSPNLEAGFFTAGWNQTVAGYTLTPGNWYYIVGTYDGATINLYVNNSLINSTNTTTPAYSSNGGIRLMNRWDNPEFWDGYLSTVAIYDKALNPGQVSSIWNTTKSRYGL